MKILLTNQLEVPRYRNPLDALEVPRYRNPLHALEERQRRRADERVQQAFQMVLKAYALDHYKRRALHEKEDDDEMGGKHIRCMRETDEVKRKIEVEGFTEEELASI